MTQPDLFFGYGSLVNRASHDYPFHGLARLHGWRRMWRRAPGRPAAFLSVEPCSDCSVYGIVAEVLGGDWSSLDAREAAYARKDTGDALEPSAAPLVIYVMKRSESEPPSDAHPVLLSYLDVVLTGFLDLIGANGPAHFAQTTTGWTDGPILNDRAAPRYSRAEAATDAGRAASDKLLGTLGCRVI